MLDVRRRQFISLLGGAAVTWPLEAWAQQPAKLPTIGYLSGATSAAESQRGAAFIQRLRELGWIDGHTIAIQSRWAQGRPEQFVEIAVEFARQKVDIIVATGTPPALAAKQATSVIPIVFVAVADPLGTGLVASLARPGGNITGLSSQFTDIVGKRLELLHGIVPGLRRLAIMANVGNPAIKLEFGKALQRPEPSASSPPYSKSD
jgi:putative ABC transport system substrate-binding protein